MSFRSVVLHFSTHPEIRRMVSDSAAARRLSRRWVAGEKLEEALTAIAAVNAAGLSATLDHLGENVNTQKEARAACDMCLRMLEAIHDRGLDCNVSLKLTQLGLDQSVEVCRQHLSEILTKAGGYGSFVRIDMEGSAYTARTLAMVHEMHVRFNNVGAVIQAYLQRSDQDVADLLAARIRIRLCKGAYQEPPEIAYQRKQDVDRNFVRLTQELLSSGVYHGIATHDPKMIQAAIDYAKAHDIPASAFEFQMLYGIRRDLQQKLRAEGWNVRVYIPFGTHWFPYLTRRLAERPANLIFLLRNLVRG
jgi:proline dehydrogenase